MRESFRDQIPEAITKERSRLEALLKSMTSGVLIVNDEKKISLANPAAASILGVEVEKLIGYTIQDAVMQAEVKELFDLAAPADGHLITREIPIQNFKTSTAKIVRAHLSDVSDPLGKRSEKVLILDDITKEKEVENLKSEFVSTVSHELRTPMTIIREGVSQILDGVVGETTEDQRQCLAITLQGIDRLSHIVSDLLDVSRLESGKLQLTQELIDIVGVAKTAIASFTSQLLGNGIQINTQFSKECIELYADRDKVGQVFRNLIGNALKFMQKGRIDIAVIERENAVECSVSDTGKGIAREDLPRVFDKFQQFGRTAGPGEKGTGLGLAICKGIVELHRGKIWAQSEPGDGAKFTFMLPKSSALKMWTECVGRELSDAIKRESFLSIIVLHVASFGEEVGIQREPARTVIQELKKLVRECLRRKADIAVEGPEGFLVVLPGTRKEDALIVTGRIRQVVDEYLAQGGLVGKIKISARVAAYPEDGAATEEILAKAA